MIDRAQSLLSLGNTVLVTLVLVIGTIAGGGYWVAQVNGDIETLQNDMARLQADMTETRSEIEELRAEVRTDVEDLRVDIAAMQSDVRVILEKIGNCASVLGHSTSDQSPIGITDSFTRHAY